MILVRQPLKERHTLGAKTKIISALRPFFIHINRSAADKHAVAVKLLALRVIKYMQAAAVEASHRCTRRTVWRSCQMHHKYLGLEREGQLECFCRFAKKKRCKYFGF